MPSTSTSTSTPLKLSFATGGNIFVVTATKSGIDVIPNFTNQELNLSFVASLTDAAIHKILSAPEEGGNDNSEWMQSLLSLLVAVIVPR